MQKSCARLEQNKKNQGDKNKNRGGSANKEKQKNANGGIHLYLSFGNQMNNFNHECIQSYQTQSGESKKREREIQNNEDEENQGDKNNNGVGSRSAKKQKKKFEDKETQMKVKFLDYCMQTYLALLQDKSDKGKSMRSTIMGLLSRTHSFSQVNAAFKETSKYRVKKDWYDKCRNDMDNIIIKNYFVSKQNE